MTVKLPPRVTVKQAALLIGRDVSRIYHWISEERLTTETDTRGITTLATAEVCELDLIMTRRRSFTVNTPSM